MTRNSQSNDVIFFPKIYRMYVSGHTFLDEIKKNIKGLKSSPIPFISWLTIFFKIFLQSDFFKYDIDANQWTMITDDTSVQGGPMLIFDHQMCIDPDTQTIYVFGGQSLYLSMTDGPVSITEKMYSGLYEYHIPRYDCR